MSSDFVPPKEVEVVRLVNKGLNEFSRNRYLDAQESFSRALALDVNNEAIMRSLALVYLRLGAIDHSLALLKSLLKEYPSSPETNFEIGSAYHAKGQYHRALAFFEVALTESLRMEEEQNLKALQASGGTNGTHASVVNSSSDLVNDTTGDQELGRALIATDSEGITRFSIRSETLSPATIYAAIAEVAYALGMLETALCAQENVLERLNTGEALVSTLEYYSSIGTYELAEKVVDRTTSAALQLRSAELMHFKALLALARMDLTLFEKYESAAWEAFDRNQLTEDELLFFLEWLRDPEGVTDVPELLQQREAFWPVEVRELLRYGPTNGEIVAKLKSVGDELSVYADDLNE